MSTLRELAESVAPYVSAEVARRVLAASQGDPQRAPRPGEYIPVEAVVLFADVAGFTAVSERMALLGPLGAEELTRMLNETFSALIVEVAAHGGNVARFSGDALTAYFVRPPEAPPGETVRCALACAQAMQRAMAALQVRLAGADGQPFPLSIKIGAAYGPAALMTVGHVEHGLEHVLAGAAMDLAFVAEHHARAGEVIAHSLMRALSPACFPAESLEERDGYVVVPQSPPLACRLDGKSEDIAQVDLSGVGDADLSAFIERCVPFVPRSVYARLEAGEGDFAGEHRRVTSMFVNFSGLSYDVPWAGEELQSYFRAMQERVAHFGGRLNRVLTGGDQGATLHIIFGAPDTHEDDLFRALRCALAIRERTKGLAIVTEQRIGIASGIVFGGPVGSATRREYTVIGGTVNLSWRLTFACAPGQIWVDAYSRDRTAQRFDYESLPPLPLKGIAEPARAFRLMDERAIETGLSARYLTSRWPLVGRERERKALLGAADQALAGHGCTVAVSGRAGVGKTRLIEEIVSHWLAAGGNGYSGECLSHGLNVPYLPWTIFFTAFFGCLDADSTEARWQKVEAVVVEDAPDWLPWMGVLAPLLGLMAPASSPVLLWDAAERRRRLFEITTTLLRARAGRSPLLALFEDIHWADRSSLELLDHVAARVGDVPLLVCLSFRPRDDLDLEILNSLDCTWKDLGELEQENSAELVRTILGAHDLKPSIARLTLEVHEKTQGNPLFVEQVCASLIESGVLVRDDDQYRLVGDASRVQVPDSLQNLLMARLDRLEPPTRDLLQFASVIGLRFAFDILRGSYPYPMADTEMRERLNLLVRADLARLERPDPELAYLFKHALTYEVVYNCLPFARRRELHARVGDFLEQFYHDHLDEIGGVLAGHFAQGQQWGKALYAALIAGTRAQELYARQEALTYYQIAEEYLGHLQLEAVWLQALRLYLNRGRLYHQLGQYTAAEADLQLALGVARAHDDTRAQAEAYNILAESYWWQSRNDDLLAAARKAYEIAREGGHTAEMAASTRMMGVTYQTLGKWARAKRYLDEALRLAVDLGDEPLRATVLNELGINRASEGELDEALDLFQRCLEIRQRIGLKDKIASALVNLAQVYQRRGDVAGSLAAFQQAIALAREVESGALPYSLLSQAEVEAYAGHYDVALQLAQEAREIFAARQDATGLAWVKLRLGRDVYLDQGRDDLARPALQEALAVMRASASYEEIVQALLGLSVVALRAGDTATARAHLDEARELCRARSLAWPLAEVLVCQGRVALAEGHAAEAESLARAALDAIEQRSCAACRGPALKVLAQAAVLRGDRAAAQRLHAQAVEWAQKQCRHADRVEILERRL